MTDFSKMIDRLIGVEGGYSNNPSDTGGETMFGITKAVAVRYGYTGMMKAMPRTTAVEIYRKQYLTEPQFDKVAAISPAIAEELFDTGVNMGVGKASEFLQIALNAFNKHGSLYRDIPEDGAIGSGTLSALSAFLRSRGADGEAVMLRALNCLQGARYIELSRLRGANEDFVFGWIKNRVY